ncbi:hypothetical protein D3C74_354060 [compost metagenome]
MEGGINIVCKYPCLKSVNRIVDMFNTLFNGIYRIDHHDGCKHFLAGYVGITWNVHQHRWTQNASFSLTACCHFSPGLFGFFNPVECTLYILGGNQCRHHRIRAQWVSDHHLFSRFSETPDEFFRDITMYVNAL